MLGDLTFMGASHYWKIEVACFINKYITCRLPPKETFPTLYDRVCKYQTHTHNNYCIRQKIAKQENRWKYAGLVFQEKPEQRSLSNRECGYITSNSSFWHRRQYSYKKNICTPGKKPKSKIEKWTKEYDWRWLWYNLSKLRWRSLS